MKRALDLLLAGGFDRDLHHKHGAIVSGQGNEIIKNGVSLSQSEMAFNGRTKAFAKFHRAAHGQGGLLF